MNSTNGVILNAYPDSIGGNLGEIARFLSLSQLKGVFECFYILPSVFNSDIDRGFSIIDYDINETVASAGDLEKIKELGIALKLDFILNHISVLSKQFQDILQNGKESKYKDFFIDWNAFWDGYGKMTEGGYIQPDPQMIENMFFRKPGLPLLMVRLKDGTEVPYWNTFYQKIEDDGKSRKYLGQMDLNVKSPHVWEYYEETLKKLYDYGAQIVRLDAFAYTSKKPGSRNFLNEPDTWDILGRLKKIADKYGLTLLPEIHASYEDKIHEKLAKEGYLSYDFFLPGLIIDAFERQTNEALLRWINDILKNRLSVINMLGCHDGIPLLDLKGLLTEEQIENLVNLVKSRGGIVKDLHGKTNVYYQVNSTYYSALGENDNALLLARAIQIFMPARPQVWYLDLLAGKNDYDAVKKAGADGHKEINRTNLTFSFAVNKLETDVVQKQLALLRFRNEHPAFGKEAKITILDSAPHELNLRWECHDSAAELRADLQTLTFEIICEGKGPRISTN